MFRDPDLALIMYSLLMLPGVLLHEGSHWLAATFLGVRAGRFSVVPERLADGTLRLGYVETEHADPLRESLIGVAPLLSGAAAIIFVGYSRLGVAPLGAALALGDLLGAGTALRAHDPPAEFLAVAIPHLHDLQLDAALRLRPPGLAAGGGDAGRSHRFVLLPWSGPGADGDPGSAAGRGMRALAAAFTITVGLDAVLAPLIWLFERA